MAPKDRMKEERGEQEGRGTHRHTHRSIFDGDKWACITKLLSLAWEQMAELQSHIKKMTSFLMYYKRMNHF